jgi:hypothetical protein
LIPRHVLRFTLLLVSFGGASVRAESPFEFESVASLEEMVAVVGSKAPLGTLRAAVRHTFVKMGQATLIVRPTNPKVEKYVYDIDLCQYYIWRWNISADYDDEGRLQQAYVNGRIVHARGTPMKVVPKVAEPGKRASIYKLRRGRPEAHKGESSLSYLLFDRDSDLKTTDDQAAMGAGPSRADPLNMGALITYKDVDPWRSIFDRDAAAKIVPYRGDCNEVDQRVGSRTR